MGLNQISKVVSYKEKVYDELKQAILRNDLKSGELLNERALADSLGISRTPVREALQLLEKEGWVETEPCKGTWVRHITGKDIAEIYQMRLIMEPLAIDLAIQTMGEEEMHKLQAILNSQKVLNNRIVNQEFSNIENKNFTDRDMEFHLYLAQLSGNRLLYQTMNSFMDIMSRYLLQTIRVKQPYSVPISEHEEILNAILQRNSVAAQNAVIEHIKRAYNTAIETMGVI